MTSTLFLRSLTFATDERLAQPDAPQRLKNQAPKTRKEGAELKCAAPGTELPTLDRRRPIV